MDTVTSVLESLKQNGIEITKHRNGKLSGTITLADNQEIMTSIPYDEGFTVKIDGKKTETGIFADTFMTIKCPPGEHEVQISYISPGVMTGCIICIISLILSVLYFKINRRNKKQQ